MGDIFGKYELIKKVARGGMAEVFLARRADEDDGYGKHVAIKRLFPHLTEDQETIDMFLDEGRIAASLEHPNIVQIQELGVVDDFLYIAMEYIHGRDLRSVLEEGYTQDNFIPIELAASLGAQVAAGLHYAHTHADESGAPMNIVHRDVSPQNILISADGTVKICDFGIAKAEHRLSHTQAGQVKGKFSYMAPEQIETSQVDPRSDVFALGIVLYEATTMTRLFRADNQYEALEKILYAGIEPPTSLRSGYPSELEKIVMKALERDPASRFQTAEQMQVELDNWLVQNQASTSAVPLARYIRGLFPALSKPVTDAIAEATGPMQVSEDVVKAVDAKANEFGPSDLDRTIVQDFDRDAAMEAAAEASREMETVTDGQKRDVTEMDEDDLDKALDFALGAPSEADVVVQRPTSEVSVVDEEPETDYGGEDATMISKQVDQLAGRDAENAAAPPPHTKSVEPPKPAAPPVSTSKIVPTVTREPEVPNPAGLGAETSEPPAADRSGPPSAAPPPAVRSGNVATGPPPSRKPPAPADSRPHPAFADPDPAPSDISLDELGDASQLSDKKVGIFVAIVAILAVIGFVLMYAAGLDTDGSEMEQVVDRSQIDPDMLVIEAAPKPERVMVGVEIAPAEATAAAVIVNGLPVELNGGQIPLVQGEKNEINVYAPGHVPARAFVDGDSSGSPISFTLEPLAEIPPADTADLNVMTEPRDAKVWVDGQHVGTSPTTVTGLWTGAEHHVYIEADGRFGYAGFIGLVKGSENLVNVKLDKLEGGRKNYVEGLFTAIPRGSMVRIEGEADPLGATPFFKNIDRNTFLTVNIEEKDSVAMRRHVALEDVGTFELRPFLTPMKREKGTITLYVEPMGPELYVGPNAYGQGPAGNLSLPEGQVKVVLDTVHGRQEVAVDVIANTHTRYTLAHDQSGVTVTTKK